MVLMVNTSLGSVKATNKPWFRVPWRPATQKFEMHQIHPEIAGCLSVIQIYRITCPYRINDS